MVVFDECDNEEVWNQEVDRKYNYDCGDDIMDMLQQLVSGRLLVDGCVSGM